MVGFAYRLLLLHHLSFSCCDCGVRWVIASPPLLFLSYLAQIRQHFKWTLSGRNQVITTNINITGVPSKEICIQSLIFVISNFTGYTWKSCLKNRLCFTFRHDNINTSCASPNGEHEFSNYVVRFRAHIDFVFFLAEIKRVNH